MPRESKAMAGKVCLVTGATRGLGQAAALALARKGATVVIVGRSRARIENTLAMLRAESGSSSVEGLQGDLSCQAEIHRVAREFLQRHAALDVLINNVGATLLDFQASPDGLEMTWSLNYLGHFLMSYLMTGALKTAAQARGEARVVEVTSSMYRLSQPRFDRLPKKKGYNGVLAYSLSKRAVNTYTFEMARRLQDTGVTINAVTPGAVKTDIADGVWWARMMMVVMHQFSVPPEQGVQPIVRLASAPELRGVSGKYFRKDQQMPDDPTCQGHAEVKQLWQVSESLLGLR